MNQYDAPRAAAFHINHFVETGDRYALPALAKLTRPTPAVSSEAEAEAEHQPVAALQGAR